MDLVEVVYRLSAGLPDHETFGLCSQLRLAAVSLPSNIAEGAARRSTAEFIQFLSIVHGFLYEIDTQVQIAQRLGYVTIDADFDGPLDKTLAKLKTC